MDQRFTTSFRDLDGEPHRSCVFETAGFHFHRTSISPFRRMAYEHRRDHHVMFVTFAGKTRRGMAFTEGVGRQSAPDFAGAVTFVPAGRQHRSILEHGRLVCGYIAIDPTSFEPVSGVRSNDWGAAFNASLPRVHRQIAVLDQLVDRQPDLPLAVFEGLAAAIMRSTEQMFAKVDRRKDDGRLDASALKRVLEMIEADIAKELSLAELAGEAGLGTSAFIRGFRGSLGMTPGRYIQDRRVARARTMLIEDRLSVAAIAQALGFADRSHFANNFRRWQGCSPGMYRRDAGVRA